MILSQAGDIKVVAEAESFGDLRQRLRGVECDVLLIDIEMPGKTGIEGVGLLKKELPKLAMIVLSMHREDQYAVRALRAGASGYLNKSSAAEKLVEAVRHVATGRKFVT
jgi:DNA-binding NarL/FixJ family response regulator